MGVQRLPTRARATIEPLDAYRLLSAGMPSFVKHPLALHADAAPAAWGTIDAPADWARLTPARNVLQTIDHRFHQWSEYETPRGTFIVTREPEALRLTAREAAGLLSASASWTAGRPDAPDRDGSMPAPTPAADRATAVSSDTAGAPVKAGPIDPAADPFAGLGPAQTSGLAGGNGPRTIFGTDDRARVANTTLDPFKTVGFLEVAPPGGPLFRGSGFVVAPYTVLTNAHHVYYPDSGYAELARFSPAQYRENGLRRPFGSQFATSWVTNDQWINGTASDPLARARHDYAALFFANSWAAAGIGTFVPLAFDVTPGAVQTSGYPAAVPGDANNIDQWQSTGTGSTVADRLLSFDNDITAGTDGGPVWTTLGSPGGRRVVALVAYAGPAANSGPRLVAENQALIGRWMSYVPWAPDRFEPNDSLATATPLGVVAGRREEGLTLHHLDADDYFTFRPLADGPARIDVNFDHEAGDVDVLLFDEAAGTVLGQGTSADDDESITATLDADRTYTLRVYGYAGASSPDYDLVIDAADPPPDRFEPNDAFQTAADLGVIAGGDGEAGLTIHAPGNEDWYRLTTAAAGTLTIDVRFAHAVGNLDVAVLLGGKFLVGAASLDDDETITIQAPANATYSVAVYGVGGAVNAYDLNYAIAAAPTVVGSAFAYESELAVSVEFDRDVSASLAASDLVLTSPGRPNAAPTAVRWDAAARRATWTIDPALPDAQWRATLPAGSVAGPGGALAADAVVADFHWLAGDANRDRAVNFADLVILAQNYGASGRTFSQGNFDYSAGGTVGFSDLVILAQRYNQSLLTTASRPAGDADARDRRAPAIDALL